MYPETRTQSDNRRLAKASMCQAREAAKKQRANLTAQLWENRSLQYKEDRITNLGAPSQPVLDVEPDHTQQGIVSALPINKHATTATRLAILLRFAVAKALASCNQRQRGLTAITAFTPRLFGVHHGKIADPAPTIVVNICSANSSNTTKLLPGSRADISAASTKALHDLNEHIENLLLQMLSLKLQTALKCTLLDSFPSLEHKTYQTDLHIFNSVNGIIMSWKACKALGIFPPCYPQPPPQT